jgi:hypothetical protein
MWLKRLRMAFAAGCGTVGVQPEMVLSGIAVWYLIRRSQS